MYKLHIIFLLSFVSIFYACKNTNSDESTKNTGETSDTIVSNEVKPKKEKVQLYAWVNNLRLRQAPDTKSKVIAELKEGDKLSFLDEKTEFTQKISLRGTLYDEPWLKVETLTGKIGWVYGGAVKFYKPTIDSAPSPYDACFELQNRGHKQAADCFSKIAEKQLRKDARYIYPNDEGYSITLLSGKKIELLNTRNTTNELDNVRYAYSYYIPKLGYFVFERIIAEGGNYILVNDKSGKQIDIWGYPKASPNAKYLVVTSDDLEAGFIMNGIQILGFTENGLEVIFEKELNEEGPINPKWLDSKTLEVGLRPSFASGSNNVRKVEIKLGDDGQWKMGE